MTQLAFMIRLDSCSYRSERGLVLWETVVIAVAWCGVGLAGGGVRVLASLSRRRRARGCRRGGAVVVPALCRLSRRRSLGRVGLLRYRAVALLGVLRLTCSVVRCMSVSQHRLILPKFLLQIPLRTKAIPAPGLAKPTEKAITLAAYVQLQYNSLQKDTQHQDTLRRAIGSTSCRCRCAISGLLWRIRLLVGACRWRLVCLGSSLGLVASISGGSLVWERISSVSKQLCTYRSNIRSLMPSAAEDVLYSLIQPSATTM